EALEHAVREAGEALAGAVDEFVARLLLAVLQPIDPALDLDGLGTRGGHAGNIIEVWEGVAKPQAAYRVGDENPNKPRNHSNRLVGGAGADDARSDRHQLEQRIVRADAPAGVRARRGVAAPLGRGADGFLPARAAAAPVGSAAAARALSRRRSESPRFRRQRH